MKRLILILLCHLLPLAHGQAMGPPAVSDVAFVGVTVIDVSNGRALPNRTVLAREGRIRAVGPADQIELPANCTNVEGRGRYLIPGLWDMHTHWYEPPSVPLFIANGVTGIRMMVGFPLHHQWRTAISSGEMIGPRLVIASGIFDGPQPVWPSSIVVENDEQARQAVRRSRDAGADFIKVYSLLPREAYLAIADEAKKLGLPFAGHVPDSILADEAAQAGQKCIEHLTGVFLACSNQREELLKEYNDAFKKARDANEPIPWIPATKRISERLHETYDENMAADLFALFKEQNTWQCPTLVVGRSIGHLNDPEFTADARLAYMSSTMRQMWNPTNDFRFQHAKDEDFANRRRQFEKDSEIVGLMNRAGVPLLAGTDTGNPYCFPGFSLHDELELFVKAGLTAADALRTATLNPARFLGEEESMGTIAPDKVADMVLLEDNPLLDIANTRKIAGVMASGRWFDRAALDAILSRIEAQAERESIGLVLFTTIKESDNVETAIAQYRDLRTNQPDRYDFGEAELNALGYRLLEGGRADDAVEIFRLNVEMFPNASNPYDSLGEAYLKQGKPDLAEQNYKRALELDPGNENAAAMLERIRKPNQSLQK